MPQEDAAMELLGCSLATATDRVVERADCDRKTVRERLATVSEDGTVTQAAIDDTLAALSKVVATPETRVEVAENALSDARDAATPVATADAVRSQLTAFENELSALTERVETVGSRLSSLVDRAQDPDDAYALAQAIRDVRSSAIALQRDADSLLVEIEQFERKLDNPSTWADKLHEDLDAAEDSIAELLETADRLCESEDHSWEADPALLWAEARLQHQIQRLLLADINTERDALEQLAVADGTDDAGNEIESRITELREQIATVEKRLDEAAAPSWRQEYGETITSVTQTVETFEPPINWETVQETLERHRKQLRNET